MATIIIKTQSEWNALPKAFQDFTTIEIRSDAAVWLRIAGRPDNSHVVAWGSSHVVAWGSVAVHNFSPSSTVILWSYAVAFLMNKAKAVLKSKTARAIRPKCKLGTDGWLESEGIESKSKIVLFKRVSKDFKTQEGNPNETHWIVGASLSHPDWKPESGECGAGKFHACSRPYFCDEFAAT